MCDSCPGLYFQIRPFADRHAETELVILIDSLDLARSRVAADGSRRKLLVRLVAQSVPNVLNRTLSLPNDVYHPNAANSLRFEIRSVTASESKEMFAHHFPPDTKACHTKAFARLTRRFVQRNALGKHFRAAKTA